MIKGEMFSYKYALHNYFYINKDHTPCEKQSTIQK